MKNTKNILIDDKLILMLIYDDRVIKGGIWDSRLYINA